MRGAMPPSVAQSSSSRGSRGGKGARSAFAFSEFLADGTKVKVCKLCGVRRDAPNPFKGMAAEQPEISVWKDHTPWLFGEYMNPKGFICKASFMTFHVGGFAAEHGAITKYEVFTSTDPAKHSEFLEAQARLIAYKNDHPDSV